MTMIPRDFGPVRGLRVLDIGTLLAGPFAASLLADFGADVIKIEQPRTGDPIRQFGLPGEGGDSLTWANEGRNKRCITLDLRREEGQALFKRLVAWADVVVENFSPGTLERWNLGWEQLEAVNPRLILVRISGFGQTGPYRDKVGLDRIALGFSGMTYVTGYPDRAPVRSSISVADYLGGTFGALAALMAIYERDVLGSGKGQVIDLGLYEPPFRISEDVVPAFARHGFVRERTGNRNPHSAPAETFATADGRWVIIHAGFDRLFERLVKAMGREDLLEDPRFRTMRDRARHADEIHAIVGEWVAARPASAVLEALEAASVPAGLVYSVADIFADPHYRARDNLIELDDPHAGRVTLPGIIPKFSRTPGRVLHAGRPLGADNDEIYLGLLGLDRAEYEALKERGVI